MEKEKAFILDITDDMYVGTHDENTVSYFVCLLCVGIAFKPVICTTCEQMVCE